MCGLEISASTIASITVLVLVVLLLLLLLIASVLTIHLFTSLVGSRAVTGQILLVCDFAVAASLSHTELLTLRHVFLCPDTGQ